VLEVQRGNPGSPGEKKWKEESYEALRVKLWGRVQYQRKKELEVHGERKVSVWPRMN
jgi:hypothetical protein